MYYYCSKIPQKEQINQNNTLLEPAIKFEIKDNKEYKVKAIINNAIYGKKVVKN